MLQNNDGKKVSNIFIKKFDPNKIEVNKCKDKCDINIKIVNKKWEHKKVDVARDPKFQGSGS